MSNLNTAIAEVTSIVEANQKVIVTAITTALQGRTKDAETIQVQMVGYIKAISTLSKAILKNDPVLTAIFGLDIKGPDRLKLAGWIEACTPIRVRFDRDTGKFQDIAWSDRHVKACKDSGVPTFDMARLESARWDMFDPKAGKLASDPRLQRGIDALIREMTRSLDTGMASLPDMVRTLKEAMTAENLAASMETVRGQQGHIDFLDSWNLKQALAKREAK